MSQTECHTYCPIMAVLEMMAKKWTLLIIKTIASGATSYSQIEKEISEINPSILSSRLKELQSIGFIEKNIVSQSPVKIEYSLTKKGQSFSKHVDGIAVWAKEWM